MAALFSSRPAADPLAKQWPRALSPVPHGLAPLDKLEGSAAYDIEQAEMTQGRAQDGAEARSQELVGLGMPAGAFAGAGQFTPAAVARAAAVAPAAAARGPALRAPTTQNTSSEFRPYGPLIPELAPSTSGEPPTPAVLKRELGPRRGLGHVYRLQPAYAIHMPPQETSSMHWSDVNLRVDYIYDQTRPARSLGLFGGVAATPVAESHGHRLQGLSAGKNRGTRDESGGSKLQASVTSIDSTGSRTSSSGSSGSSGGSGGSGGSGPLWQRRGTAAPEPLVFLPPGAARGRSRVERPRLAAGALAPQMDTPIPALAATAAADPRSRAKLVDRFRRTVTRIIR